MEGSYNDGLKHGPSIMWHLNGMKWREQNHQNGKPVGVWKSWDDRGELLEEIVHEKNSCEINLINLPCSKIVT